MIMGRPPKAPEDRRDEDIKIPLTAAEKQAIWEAANADDAKPITCAATCFSRPRGGELRRKIAERWGIEPGRRRPAPIAANRSATSPRRRPLSETCGCLPRFRRCPMKEITSDTITVPTLSEHPGSLLWRPRMVELKRQRDPTDFRQNVASEVEDQQSSPASFDIVTFPADYTLRGLFQKMDNSEIVIPKFQRQFVWKLKQSSRLIESFLLGLPVPPIFLFTGRG